MVLRCFSSHRNWLSVDEPEFINLITSRAIKDYPASSKATLRAATYAPQLPKIRFHNGKNFLIFIYGFNTGSLFLPRHPFFCWFNLLKPIYKNRILVLNLKVDLYTSATSHRN